MSGEKDKRVLYSYVINNTDHISPNLQVAIKRSDDGLIKMIEKGEVIDKFKIQHEEI